MTTPQAAPNKTTNLAGTWGGVQPPCWCNTNACTHTLDPINQSQVIPQVVHGVRRKSANGGQTYD